MPRFLFVTGKLAEPALRQVLATLAPKAGFEYDVAVLNISVAALMTPEWVARRLEVPPGIEHIYVPGACSGDWKILEQAAEVPVTPGPGEVLDLPEYFGEQGERDYGAFDITILAEINHAPRLTWEELLREALRFKKQGADVIDLGCEPGLTWAGLSDAVKALRDKGMRVSVDTFDTTEAAQGAAAGAELILSVNSTNREASRDWGCEVVAIPDSPIGQKGDWWGAFGETVEYLTKHDVKYRLDPILEPIGFGFAASLQRYMETRAKYPQHEMMMGIGNLTELTEADSAPINLLLLAICQELRIGSVLTTAVANWANTSVRECDIARRLVHYAITQKRLPKGVDHRLVSLRDRKVRELGTVVLEQLARDIKDRNYRIFAESNQLHVINGEMYLQGEDPFELFEKMCQRDAKMDLAHAFYLGYEMAKAVTALTLRKTYAQDQALSWGYLTKPEESHRQRKAEREGGDRASG
jgi:dihydropteroate synthase-like protein